MCRHDRWTRGENPDDAHVRPQSGTRSTRAAWRLSPGAEEQAASREPRSARTPPPRCCCCPRARSGASRTVLLQRLPDRMSPQPRSQGHTGQRGTVTTLSVNGATWRRSPRADPLRAPGPRHRAGSQSRTRPLTHHPWSGTQRVRDMSPPGRPGPRPPAMAPPPKERRSGPWTVHCPPQLGQRPAADSPGGERTRRCVAFTCVQALSRGPLLHLRVAAGAPRPFSWLQKSLQPRKDYRQKGFGP